MKLSPKKSLGQNFLINAGILEKIVSAAKLSLDDTVLEIGPGTGNLTKLLSEKAGHVIAIEKDHRLIENLKEKFKNSNVEIIEGDILKIDIVSISKAYGKVVGNLQYKIVANIPYYITSHFLKTIFESASWRMVRPKLIVLTVQKEVAKRITAKPPNMNLLALSIQLYSEPKIIGYISRGSFRPIPNVDSAIIRLNPKSEKLNPKQKGTFFKLIKAGFSGKRKQLINNLSKNLSIGILKENLLKRFDEVGLKNDIRAENLSLNQWLSLSEELD